MKRKNTKRILYGTGGTLGSVVGAGIGSIIPGVGTMIGGEVGNMIGGMFDKRTTNQNNGVTNSNQTIITPYQEQNSLQTYNPYGNTMGYALGGQLNTQTPGSQQITQYQGPSHEQGGIPLGNTGNEVEGGEVRVGQFIFSDRLTPGNGKSFADLAKQIEKKYSNGKGDRIGERTMMRELAKLAQIQEGIKQQIEQEEKQQGQQEQSDGQNNQQEDQQQEQLQPQGQQQEQPQQPVGSQQGPQNGSGPNGQMMQAMQQQAMQNQQQPQQQMAYGGMINNIRRPEYIAQPVNSRIDINKKKKKLAYGGTIDNPPFRLSDIFRPAQHSKNMASDLNSNYNGSAYYDKNNGGWIYKSTHAPSGYSSYGAVKSPTGNYMGSPYAPINVGIKIPISRSKTFNNKTGKYVYNSLKPEAQIKPLYFYTPKSFGKFAGGQYIPNLFGIGNNDIGKYVWGENKQYLTKKAGNKLGNKVANDMLSNVRNNTYAYGGTIPPDNKPTNYSDTTKNVTPNYVRRDGKIHKKGVNGFLMKVGVKPIPTAYGTQTQYANQGVGPILNYVNSTVRAIKAGPIHTMTREEFEKQKALREQQRKQYAVGGEIPPNMTDNSIQEQGLNSDQPLETYQYPDTSIYDNNTQEQSDNPKTLNDYLKLFKANNTGKTALSTLGGIYDVARGSKGGSYEYYNRLNNVNYTHLNPNTAINNTQQQSNYAMNRVGNIGGQGLGQYLNNINSINSNTQNAIGKITSQYDNANNNLDNKSISANSLIAQKNISTDMAQNNINAKERDMASNDIQHGLTTIGQGFNQQFADQSRENAQDQTISLIGQKHTKYIPDPNNSGKYIQVGVEIGRDGKQYIFRNGYVYDSNNNLLGTKQQVINTGIFG